MSEWNDEESNKWYLELTESDRLIFLALLSGDLTIHGRAFGLELSGEQQIRAFKGLNELQHLISFHLVGIGMKRDRYPNDAFLSILLERAASFGILAHLKQSFHSARSRDCWEGPQ